MNRIKQLLRKRIKYIFKIIVIGNTGVGKTALLRRFIEDSFSPSSSITLGVDVLTTNIRVNGDLVRLQCCDVAGVNYFSRFRPTYYRGAKGALLVFDISRSTTVEELDLWLRELKINITEDIPIVLVGNKVDFVDDERETFKEQLETFIEHNRLGFYEASAKTGYNAEEPFYNLSWRMIEKNNPIFQSEKFNSFLDYPLIKSLNCKSLKLLSTFFCPFCGAKGLITGQHRKTHQEWLICLNCTNRVH
ncbi:MAG: Rab family GTPase [Candidatus Hodarchaeota archaeon]